ncbi:MAG: hypothetical protein ACK53L_17245, partial [Pirellulaceae bacterium]
MQTSRGFIHHHQGRPALLREGLAELQSLQLPRPHRRQTLPQGKVPQAEVDERAELALEEPLAPNKRSGLLDGQ